MTRAKLTTLKPAVSSLAPRISFGDGTKEQRALPAPVWKRWYHTKRWERLRRSVFVRDLFTCRMCGQTSPADRLTADHTRPHRGDPGLFWDPSNIQTLCTSPCHVSHKQRLESTGG